MRRWADITGCPEPGMAASTSSQPVNERSVGVTNSITTISSAQGAARERRRPGRVRYTNPHLVELLRHSTDAERLRNDQGDAAESGDDLSIAPKQSALLSDTISLVDGASQVGSPQPRYHPEQESRIIWDGPFLANQACYVAGVLIASTKGPVPVESLTAGDVVLTHSGNRRITWARRFRLNSVDVRHPERSAPVRLRRDAIAPGLPGTDLLVSPSHCLWVESCLVPARLLINGRTVVQDLEIPSVDYCHILYDRSTHGQLAVSPDKVAPIWHTLANRAERLEYAHTSPDGMSTRGVRLLIDGKSVDPVAIDGNRRIFVAPSGHRVLQLASPDNTAVIKIETITQDAHEVIPADHPDLLLGWGPCERDAQVTWRQILGVAQLPVSHGTENAKVVVHLKS
jgi:Hint domain